MLLTETIVALSSPPAGSGVRAIVRLSGDDAWPLARAVAALPEDARPGWHARLPLRILPGRPPLASALLFRAPRSFTGEDVAELHLPDSPALVRECLDRILREGRDKARLAGPGEFSARAFFHGKIDLTEAEGIAATINASTETQLRAAASLRAGDLHKQIQREAESLADALALVEAGIDFAEEEHVQFIDARNLLTKLECMCDGLHHWIAFSVRVDRLDTLPTVVFVGEPNVGKSSLINALALQQRSITSEVAGTTRDMLSVTMQTPAGPVILVDVPGEEEPTNDLKRKMMEARQAALMEADFIVDVVVDDQRIVSNWAVSQRYGADMYRVQNKVDLLPPGTVRTFEYLPESDEFMEAREAFQMVSAKTGLHIEELRDKIGKMAHRGNFIGQTRPALNQRHRLLLQQAKEAIDDTHRFLDWHNNKLRNPELLAADLRRALDLLGQITGTISPDDILGRIFSTFCIGK